MKAIRIIALAAAAGGFLTLGACKTKEPASYTPPPAPAGGTYIDSGK